MPEAAFRDVDGSGEPDALVRYLDATKELALFRDLGRMLLAELRIGPGSAVLDVGCGTGEDALAIAAIVAPGGRVVGVDASATMVAEARRRAAGREPAVDFRLGRAERLHAPDASVDACRFERVLQHMPDPLQALREAARVLRAGGRVAVLEPDWLALDIRGADPGLTRRVLDAWVGTIPSPGVGARLPRLLAHAGFDEVRATDVTPSGGDAAPLRSLRLETYAGAAAAAGAVTAEESAAWLRSLGEARAAGALAVRGRLHLAAGTRPARPRQARRSL